MMHVGDIMSTVERSCDFDPDFLQPILKYSTIFSVFAKNLRVVSSNREDFHGVLLFSAFE